jgi:predicted DNA-binding protein with PD1-like motif
MRQVSFRLKEGQLLKEEIEKAAIEHNIGAGVLVSLVGGLRKITFRLSTAVPGEHQYRTVDGPLEIVGGTGTISKEGCHLHIVVTDTKGNAVGGHLKDGCPVFFTVEVVFLVFDDVEYHRVMDADTGYKELTIEKK